MDANGNGKRDPLHGGPVYSHRRAASNDVSERIIVLKNTPEFHITYKCAGELRLSSNPILFDSTHSYNLIILLSSTNK